MLKLRIVSSGIVAPGSSDISGFVASIKLAISSSSSQTPPPSRTSRGTLSPSQVKPTFVIRASDPVEFSMLQLTWFPCLEKPSMRSPGHSAISTGVGIDVGSGFSVGGASVGVMGGVSVRLKPSTGTKPFPLSLSSAAEGLNTRIASRATIGTALAGIIQVGNGLLGGMAIESAARPGKVVKATAEKNEEFLLSVLDADEGARYLGEFAIGTNTKIDRFIKNILFDEKIGGTIHMALGAGYPETGSVNKSAIHMDMICDMRDGGQIHVDGELFYDSGEFKI